MDNGSKIPISVILKLFDQVKESSSDNTEAIKEVKEAIKEWLIYEKAQPSHKDMAKDIDSCKRHLETIGSMDKSLHSLKSWVKTMILVVLVTFSILTITFIFVQSTVDTTVKRHVGSAIDNKVEIILDKLEEFNIG